MTITRSFSFSLLQNYGTTVIAFVSSMLIARILTPEEIGVFSVGAALIAISHAFRDFGISNYLVQEPKLQDEKVAAALCIAFIISWLIAILVFFGGFAASLFYQEQRVGVVLHLLAINFVLLPLSSVGMALLRRSLNFGKICTINIAASLVQAVVAVSLALEGFSYLSLVVGSIVATLVTVLLTLYFVSIKSFVSTSRAVVKLVIKRTGTLSVISILYEFGYALPEMVIGKTIGFSAVSYYSKALSTLDVVDKIILGAIRPILLPYLSEISRQRKIDNTDVNNLLNFPLAVTWPLLLFIAFYPDFIVLFLFGSQWQGAADLIPVLCFAAAIKNIISVTSPIIIANGDYRIALRYQFVNQVFRVVAIFLGAMFGLVGVCFAVVVSELFATTWILQLISQQYQFSVRLLVASLTKLVMMQLVLLLVIISFEYFFNQLFLSQLTEFLLLIPFLIVVWLSILKLTENPLYSFISDVLVKRILVSLRKNL